MPTRFVEVVDVSGRASSVFATLMPSSFAWLTTLYQQAFDVWDRGQEGVCNLQELLTGAELQATLNRTVSDLPPLRGSARRLILLGVVIITCYELAVRWQVNKMVHAHGVCTARARA